jgi:hypothetical protein
MGSDECRSLGGSLEIDGGLCRSFKGSFARESAGEFSLDCRGRPVPLRGRFSWRSECEPDAERVVCGLSGPLGCGAFCGAFCGVNAFFGRRDDSRFGAPLGIYELLLSLTLRSDWRFVTCRR